VSEGPKPVAKRAGVSAGAIVTLVVAFLLLCVGMYYSDVIRGVVVLRPWSKGGAIAAVKSYAKALETNDEAALQAVGGKVGFQCGMENGRIVTVKSGGAAMQMAPIPVEQAIPSDFTPDKESYYRFSGDPPNYTLVLPSRAGGRLSFTMTRAEGKWVIISLNALGTGPS